MFIFILMNSIVGLTAYLLAGYIIQNKNIVDGILSFFILFLAQIIFSELLLGIFNLLFLNYLILLNGVILLGVFVIVKVKKPQKLIYQISYNIDWLLKDKTLLFLISIIGGFLVVKLVFNLFNPPFGWDSLNYHFTFPVEWLKRGNFYTPITISDDPTPTYYPINNSLIYLWLIFPFKSVFLADIGQIPFLIIGFFACYNIARKINLDKFKAFIAASLFTITPNYFKQIEFGYADIMMAALFLVSLNFLLLLHDEFKLKNLFLFSLSLGIFFATKTVCLTYSAILALFLFYILGKNFKSLGIRRYLNYLLLFLIIFVSLGGFSYIRNFILTGNPFYPLNIQFFGRYIFNGPMFMSTYRAHWNYDDFNLYKLFFREGMGIQFVLLFFPAMILVLPVMFLKRNKEKVNLKLIYVLSLPLVLFFIFRFIIPQLWTRFLYPFLGVSAIAALYIFAKLRIPNKIIKIITVVCFLGSIAELAGYGELIFSLVMVFAVFLVLTLIFKKSFHRKLNWKVALTGIVLVVGILSISEIDYDKNEFKRYVNNSPLWKEDTEGWRWLNENTHGDRIAYIGRPVPLPLYGSKFKNDVYYVSVNEKPSVLHAFKKGHFDWGHDFASLHNKLREEGNYREKADFNIWYKNLINANTDYFFVYRLHQLEGPIKFPIENEWAKLHPKKFNLVFSNEGIRIYRLIKTSS